MAQASCFSQLSSISEWFPWRPRLNGAPGRIWTCDLRIRSPIKADLESQWFQVNTWFNWLFLCPKFWQILGYFRENETWREQNRHILLGCQWKTLMSCLKHNLKSIVIYVLYLQTCKSCSTLKCLKLEIILPLDIITTIRESLVKELSAFLAWSTTESSPCRIQASFGY